MINRAVLALALMATLSATAEVPNPLMAPTPRGTKTVVQSLTPLPPGSPSPVTIDQPSTTFGKKQVAPGEETIDLQSTWYVSAIVGNSAMLRQRVASTSKSSTGTSQLAGAGQFPGMYAPGSSPQQNQSGQSASAETKAAVGMSLMVTDGEETFVMGLPVRARLRGDMVSLMLIDGNQRVPVFYGGVETSQNIRAERKVTEQPDSAFAGRMAPDAATGSASVSTSNAQPQSQAPFVPR